MSNNNNNDNCSFMEDAINFGKRHMGKLGTTLGVLGVITAGLIGSKFIVSGSVVLGITNLGIIIGSLEYEHLQNQFYKIEEDNKSLKLENRRLTTFQAFPSSQSVSSAQSTEMNEFLTINPTPKSDTTEPFVEPVVFKLH